MSLISLFLFFLWRVSPSGCYYGMCRLQVVFTAFVAFRLFLWRVSLSLSFMVSFVFCSPFCVCSVCRLPLVFYGVCRLQVVFTAGASGLIVFVTPSWHLCFVLFTNISARCTHWGALKRKTAAFILLFGISYPRFYGLPAWAVFYVLDLFGVFHLLLVLWAYSYLCRFISTRCVPRVTQIGPSLCFGWFFLVCCFTRSEQSVVISRLSVLYSSYQSGRSGAGSSKLCPILCL